MPTKTIWVDPELLVEYNSVRVFHLYRDDDYDQGPQGYWFTVNSQCGEHTRCHDDPCRHVFDVRELSTWHPISKPPYYFGGGESFHNNADWEQYWNLEEQGIKAAITAAIEQGELTALGWKSPSKKEKICSIDRIKSV